MSAAEKLEGLDGAAPTFPSNADIHPDLRPAIDALAALRNALPEIIALVKAAETSAPILHNALGASGMNMTPGHMLDAALAALDEALTADGNREKKQQ